LIIEVKDFLKQKECDSLIKKYNSEVTKCTTGEGYSVSGNLKKGNINPFARKTDLVVFHNHALRESIIDTISNKLNIPVNLIDKYEPFQFLRYKNTGHFAWHKDITSNREFMTCIVMLNDKFEGGNLLHKKNGEVQEFNKRTGTLHLFPATLSHKVAEVTEGVRYSLVTWIYKKQTSVI
tara:strand:- start:988 stop:1524 length:537 start_codon:yes stop_codon:yes gene_type:complete